MTDPQAEALHTQYPHMSAEAHAYYAGRNNVDDDGSLYGVCGFQIPALIAAWKRGVRDVRSELRLSADTEWDQDND